MAVSKRYTAKLSDCGIAAILGSQQACGVRATAHPTGARSVVCGHPGARTGQIYNIGLRIVSHLQVDCGSEYRDPVDRGEGEARHPPTYRTVVRIDLPTGR